MMGCKGKRCVYVWPAVVKRPPDLLTSPIWRSKSRIRSRQPRDEKQLTLDQSKPIIDVCSHLFVLLDLLQTMYHLPCKSKAIKGQLEVLGCISLLALEEPGQSSREKK